MSHAVHSGHQQNCRGCALFPDSTSDGSSPRLFDFIEGGVAETTRMHELVHRNTVSAELTGKNNSETAVVRGETCFCHSFSFNI